MLKRCLVSLHSASGLQVNFEYERLPTSSHWHGIIYHGDRLFCPSMKQRKLQYGLWLWVVRYAGRHSPWWSIISSQSYVGNWPEIPNLWETKKKKKKWENTRQRKKSHAQDNIYVVRKFAICLRPRSCKNFTIIREKYKMLLQCFSLSKNDNNDNNKTLITKNIFYILRTGPSLCSMD